MSVRRPEGATEQPTGNTARLLALLISRIDQPVSMTEIIHAVWSDADPEFVSPQQVERLVANLRQLLGNEAREIIPVRKHDRYRFEASGGRVWVDSLEFDRLACAAQVSLEAADFDGARDLALQALALWRSDPVVLSDEWRDLKQGRCNVRLVAAEAALRAGDHRLAATELGAFVEDHPDDERGWKLLVEAHLCSGERVLAARACAQATRRFAKYAGVGPALADLCRPLTVSAEPAASSAGDDLSPTATGQPPQPKPDDGVPEPPSERRTTGPRVAMVVVAAGLLAALAIFVISRAGGEDGPAFVSVYNLEAQCQTPRTTNCRLGLARDPYTSYTRPNVIGYVWHGDRLRVNCFIPDGVQVQAEDRTRSTRWYRVSVPGDAPTASPGKRAWLTAVRVRPGTAPTVPRCTDV